MAIDKTPFEIPTIDIGPYLEDPASKESAKIVEDVKTACKTTGFFSLIGHGVSKELQTKLFAAAEKLFALPLEEKKTLKHAVMKNRGYELIGSQALQEGALPDLKEVSYNLMGLVTGLDDIEWLGRGSMLESIFHKTIHVQRHTQTSLERTFSPPIYLLRS